MILDLFSKQVKDNLTDTNFLRDQKQKKHKYTVFKILQRSVGYERQCFIKIFDKLPVNVLNPGS